MAPAAALEATVKTMPTIIAVAALLLALGAGRSAVADETGAPATARERGIAGVVVQGLGGTADYAAEFADAAGVVADALVSLDPAGEAVERLDESAGREAILAAIERQGARDAGTFVLVLIGHGSVDGDSWKFNVAGPDPDGDDLIGALATVRAPRQLVVLGASASGALLETLAQPGRVVVTATKSGGEINAVRFPGFLAEALDSAAADVDRNEILTVAEAFRFADARTREYYEEADLLASEHPRLLGDEAMSLPLARLGSLRLAGDDPAVLALLDTRLELERRYRELLSRKADLPTDDYYAELETLMLSIAGLQRAIDRASGWSEDDA